MSVLCYIKTTLCNMCCIRVRCQYLKLPLFRFYLIYLIVLLCLRSCQTDTGTDRYGHRQMQSQIDAVTDRSGTDKTVLCGFSSVSSKQLAHILIQIPGVGLIAMQLRRLACIQSAQSSKLSDEQCIK